jgi:hypothetical protein
VDEYELLTEQLAGHPDEPVAFSGLVVLPAGRAVRALLAGYDEVGRITRISAEFQAVPSRSAQRS